MTLSSHFTINKQLKHETDKVSVYTIHYTIYTVLIGWQAYRGDQIHRKTYSTYSPTQIQVKKKK